MEKEAKIHAVAYLRTSSAANVGEDKDSEKRQIDAISGYAARTGLEISADDWFYDASVKGADPIETRPGFSSLLDRIESNGVRVVIVEDVSRFARDLITQELGILLLINLGVKVFTSNGLELTETDDPFKVAMRQIAGAFAQLEKARLVSKLKAARDRKKALTGKCGGRKTFAERDQSLVKAAHALNDGRSLRKIAAALAEQGYVRKQTGKPYEATCVKSMLSQAVS